MPEFVQIIVGIIFLVLVFIGTRVFVGWKMRRAAMGIIKDLESKEAFNAESAVELPYAKKDWLKIGMRDYRPKTLQALLTAGILGMTPEGRYFILKRVPVETLQS